MIDSKEVFLTLVRLGIGTRTVSGFTFQVPIDWLEVKDLAEKQGLYAVVLDGIEKLPVASRPPQELLLEWIGEVLQGYEYQYDLYRKSIAELARFYNSHGFKMMIVKGYACSLDWPKPSHRPVGDIDIWQFGKYKEADALLESSKFHDSQDSQARMSDQRSNVGFNGVKIDRSHHHHTIFRWGNFTVENHYDFLNVHQHKSNIELEKIVKELAQDDSYSVDVYGEKVYLPSSNLHALFLLRHAMTHFAASEINLRQLLDWAFFVEKHGKEVDWKWLLDILMEFGMLPMFNIFSAICVEDLGFDASIFPQVQFNPYLKDRVLNDILSPESGGEEPKMVIQRYWFKYRRWKANQWKHELCFSDSLASAFWTGIWGHLLKPALI